MNKKGFTLLEVVIAIGVVAVGVVTVLGLLPALGRQSAGSTEAMAAMRITDALRVEVRRLAATEGWDALAGRLPIMGASLADGYQLAALRDGGALHSLTDPPASAVIAPERQFFLIEVWRFASPPLAYEPGAPLLAVHARISWPYRIPGSAMIIPLANREQLACNVSLLR